MKNKWECHSLFAKTVAKDKECVTIVDKMKSLPKEAFDHSLMPISSDAKAEREEAMKLKNQLVDCNLECRNLFEQYRNNCI